MTASLKINKFKNKLLQETREKWLYSSCFLFLILLWGGTKVFNIPMYDIVADPAEICRRGPHIGFLSQAGLLAWFGGIVCCFFTLNLLKNSYKIPRKWQSFILCSGLFSILLGLDDWLQIHEYLPANILRLSDVSKGMQSILELGVYLIYFILLIVYLNYFKSLIRNTRYSFLIAAIIFFAISNLVDIFVPEIVNWHFAVEEGSKFMGIVSWSSYHWYLCKDTIKNRIHSFTPVKV